MSANYYTDIGKPENSLTRTLLIALKISALEFGFIIDMLPTY